MGETKNNWDWQIKAKTTDWNLNLRVLFSYRHLIFSLVRRNFLLSFQQTILGPVWLFVQPLLTLVVYVFIFDKLIGVKTGKQLPAVLFYYSGIVLWNFFNETFNGCSKTFRDNFYVFSKVYFPRIIMPIAVIVTQFLRFVIQLLLLIPLMLYYVIVEDVSFQFSILSFTFPLAVIGVGIISMSVGLIFSIITAKYRDVANLVDLCIRLLFFITPVVYPLSFVPENLLWFINLNPLASLFELFRLGLFGEGSVGPSQLVYPILFMLMSSILSFVLFNKLGKKLMDVI